MKDNLLKLSGIFFIDQLHLIGIPHGYLDHLLATLRQDVLDVPLALHVREPLEVVRNEMVIRAAVAFHNYHSFCVGQFGDLFRVPRAAHFARIEKVQLGG